MLSTLIDALTRSPCSGPASFVSTAKIAAPLGSPINRTPRGPKASGPADFRSGLPLSSPLVASACAADAVSAETRATTRADFSRIAASFCQGENQDRIAAFSYQYDACRAGVNHERLRTDVPVAFPGINMQFMNQSLAKPALIEIAKRVRRVVRIGILLGARGLPREHRPAGRTASRLSARGASEAGFSQAARSAADRARSPNSKNTNRCRRPGRRKHQHRQRAKGRRIGRASADPAGSTRLAFRATSGGHRAAWHRWK